MQAYKKTTVQRTIVLDIKEAEYLHRLTQNSLVQEESKEDKEIRQALFYASE